MPDNRGSRHFYSYTVVLFLILLAAGFFRFYDLGQGYIDGDEAFLYNSANRPVLEILSQKWLNLGHNEAEVLEPPLTSLLAKVFMPEKNSEAYSVPEAIEDNSVRFWFRFPFSVIGLIAVWVIYLLGSQIANRRVGLWAAILLGIFYPAVYYSRVSRPYIVMIFCAVCVAFFLYRGFRKGAVRDFVYMAFALTAFLYVHYFALMFLPVVFAWGLLLYLVLLKSDEEKKSRKFLLKYLGCLLIAVALFSPWIPTTCNAVSQSVHGASVGYQETVKTFGLSSDFILILMTNWTVGLYTPFIVFSLAMMGLGYLFLKYRVAAILLALWLLLPWSVLLLTPGNDKTHVRYMIFQMPAFVLLIAAGLDQVYLWILGKNSKKREIVAVVVVSIFALSLLWPSLRSLPIDTHSKKYAVAGKQFLDQRDGKFNWLDRLWPFSLAEIPVEKNPLHPDLYE